jgi:DegV family protein with EDD domain
MTIRIVTDSTCDIPAHVAAELGITVVPAYINVGEQSYLDGVDLTRQQFYADLPSYPAPPTTAAPASGTFTETYERLAAEGASQVISIHISSTLSAILNAARLGAEATDAVPVSLVDSRQLSLGLGLLVLTAAEAAREGRSLEEILALLDSSVRRTHVFALLDTLEFLRRSGRVSWTQFGLGTLLKIKPILHVYDGEVTIVEKVRTSKRARDRLVELVGNLGTQERLALLHTNAPEAAAELGRLGSHLFPAGARPEAYEVTPAVGAHIGPGAVGFACIAASSKVKADG